MEKIEALQQKIEAEREKVLTEKEELQQQEKERQALFRKKIEEIQDMQIKQQEWFDQFFETAGLEQSQSYSSKPKQDSLEESQGN